MCTGSMSDDALLISAVFESKNTWPDALFADVPYQLRLHSLSGIFLIIFMLEICFALMGQSHYIVIILNMSHQ